MCPGGDLGGCGEGALAMLLQQFSEFLHLEQLKQKCINHVHVVTRREGLNLKFENDGILRAWKKMCLQ